MTKQRADCLMIALYIEQSFDVAFESQLWRGPDVYEVAADLLAGDVESVRCGPVEPIEDRKEQQQRCERIKQPPGFDAGR